MIRLVFFILISIASGCSTGGVKAYADLESKLDNSNIFSERVDLTGDVRRIEMNEVVTEHIRKTDKVSLFVGRPSYYKALKFEAKDGIEHQIEIWSVCDCFGLAKRIIDPVFLLIDSEGNSIPFEIIESSYKGVSSKRAVSLYNKISFIGKKGELALILAANNNKVGESLRSFTTLAAGTFIPVWISVNSHPTGRYDVYLQEVSNKDD